MLQRLYFPKLGAEVLKVPGLTCQSSRNFLVLGGTNSGVRSLNRGLHVGFGLTWGAGQLPPHIL